MSERDLIESLNSEIVATMWKSPLGADRVALQGQYEPLTKDPIPLWPLSSVTRLLATIARLSEALAEAEKNGAEDWQPIETAPKDGTSLDLWSSEFGRHTDCHWGKPEHCCGEAGRYCDSDWHTEPEGWVDGVLNVILSDPDEFTHWRPLPAPPRDLSQGGQP